MKKRKWMTLAMLFVGVTFAACGNSDNSEEAVPEVMQAEDSSAVSPEEVGAEAGMGSIVDELISLREDVQAQEQAAASEMEQTTDETIPQNEAQSGEAGRSGKAADLQSAVEYENDVTDSQNLQELVIYYSNSKADGLETETVLVEEVTPDAIIGYLAGHNIVSIDTRVNGFEAEEESGLLQLDLSKAFGEYLKTMGSSGEAVIMAALTDTFLQAYEAESIRITVEGETIETGHAVYDEPLTFTESKLSTSFSN
ncbi:GerMN domain-containing protein [Kineothrix sedimenti]|uniref:GerMN domain-containing protein n=1 Tax=Kineothrix sedimenti TaxID=3123317 RepID=A0ABZ3ESJ7_9FIRM